MTAATTTPVSELSVPAFSYSGFSVPALTVANPPVVTDNLDGYAHQVGAASIPLAWKVGLYHVGRDLVLYENVPADLAGLPDTVKAAGRAVYARCQALPTEGSWHRDVIEYIPLSEKPKGVWAPPEGFVLARYHKDATLKQKDGSWEIVHRESTETGLVWIPLGGGAFIVPTEDGAYNLDFGIPLDTERNKQKAIQRWVDAGLTPEQATRELSRVYRLDLPGNAVPVSWSSSYYGALCVGLGNGPLDRSRSAGSFPAREAAERSEAAADITSVEVAEYQRLRAAAEKLQRIQTLINE